jgi:ketosteroid isomerase-like protein
MSDANAELMRETYEAFGRGDIPAVLAVFDADIDWHVPDAVPHGTTAHGRDEVARFFEKLVSLWEDFRVEVDEIAATGDRGYATGRATGTYDGGPASYRFVHVWTIRDGACIRFDEYVDPSPELLAAAGTAAGAAAR